MLYEVITTTRNGQLYAIALGWPESGVLTINSLGSTGYNQEVKSVELIGAKDPLKWEQKEGSLDIVLPDEKPCEHAFVFRIMR